MKNLISMTILGLALSLNAAALSNEDAGKCDQAQASQAFQQLTTIIKPDDPLGFALEGPVSEKIKKLVASASSCDDLFKSISKFGNDFSAAVENLKKTME